MNDNDDKVEESFCYVRILDRTNYKGKKDRQKVLACNFTYGNIEGPREPQLVKPRQREL